MLPAAIALADRVVSSVMLFAKNKEQQKRKSEEDKHQRQMEQRKLQQKRQQEMRRILELHKREQELRRSTEWQKRMCGALIIFVVFVGFVGLIAVFGGQSQYREVPPTQDIVEIDYQIPYEQASGEILMLKHKFKGKAAEYSSIIEKHSKLARAKQ